MKNGRVRYINIQKISAGEIAEANARLDIRASLEIQLPNNAATCCLQKRGVVIMCAPGNDEELILPADKGPGKMKKMFFLAAFFIAVFSFPGYKSFAQYPPPDTVKTAIYITSIHDIDFKQMEYTVNLWLWLTYKNKDFNFLENLEIPQAKTFTRSYSTVDETSDKIYVLMKLQCVMKNVWTVGNFPFDRQNLRLSLENSMFDSKSLIFSADTIGKQFDPRFTLYGWKIDNFIVSTGIKGYETAFGDHSINPHIENSTFRLKITISRDEPNELFWKLFLGMYVSFLIAYICFYIHADNIDSRFGLSVGALFAAIGNKYIIESSLPEFTSFTLVDTLHVLTLFFIFIVITSSIYALMLVKKGKLKQVKKFDFIMAQIVLVGYIILNVWFVVRAQMG